MEVAILICLVAIVLFVAAFVTKRRFGVLGLALAAGYVLSQLWREQIPQLVDMVGVESDAISPVTLATLSVIVLPSAVLFFGGPVCRTKRGRLVGSLLYAVLAVVFSLEALEHTLVLMGPGKHVFDMLVEFRPYILTLALVLSVVDVMHAHTTVGEKHDKKH